MNNFKTEIKRLEKERDKSEHQFNRTKIDLKKECWSNKHNMDCARLDQTLKIKKMVEEIIDKEPKYYFDGEDWIKGDGNFISVHVLKKELFGDEK